MLENWKAFLIENGVAFVNHAIVETLSSQQSVLSNPSSIGLIKVSGEDAETFLQNQFSNDIRNVSEIAHQASAWCTPKGRIIATFRIFKRQDSFYLMLANDLLEHVIKKLQMYVMMSKVTLDDVSDSFVHFSFSGANAERELQVALMDEVSVPTGAGQSLNHKTLSILRFPDANPHFEIFGELDDAKSLWLSLKADVAGENYWHYLNIVAGIPHISKLSSESWIPQMVNFIAVGGVDFKKGCYPGQEVVARLNYLGKTKRRMYRLLIDTDVLPAINDSIISEADEDAGKIVNTAINADGKVEALAVLKIAEAEKNALMLESNQTNISILDLPYTLDE